MEDSQYYFHDIVRRRGNSYLPRISATQYDNEESQYHFHDARR